MLKYLYQVQFPMSNEKLHTCSEWRFRLRYPEVCHRVHKNLQMHASGHHPDVTMTFYVEGLCPVVGFEAFGHYACKK